MIWDTRSWSRTLYGGCTLILRNIVSCYLAETSRFNIFHPQKEKWVRRKLWQCTRSSPDYRKSETSRKMTWSWRCCISITQGKIWSTKDSTRFLAYEARFCCSGSCHNGNSALRFSPCFNIDHNGRCLRGPVGADCTLVTSCRCPCIWSSDCMSHDIGWINILYSPTQGAY